MKARSKYANRLSPTRYSRYPISAMYVKAVCYMIGSLASVDEREDNANKQDRSHKDKFGCK